MNKLVVLIACACSLGIRMAEAATINQLRAGLASDAQGAQGEQFIHLGPMMNGQEIDITSKIINNSSNVFIRRTGPNSFLINMGRDLSIKAFFIFDAAMVCARFPKAACDRMPAYIEHVVESPDPAKAPILEEVFPDLRQEAQESRSDEIVYNASLLAGIQSLMAWLTLHEIGHAALHHLDGAAVDDSTILVEEGEADGFAAYVAQASGLPPMGVAGAFLLDATRETIRGITPVTHPRAVCRALMLTDESIEWLRQNKTALLTPGSDKSRDDLAAKLFDQSTKSDFAKTVSISEIESCEDYFISVASGFSKARSLVNQNTKLQSSVPGQK